MVLDEIATDFEAEHSNAGTTGNDGDVDDDDVGVFELCNRKSALSVCVKNVCSSRELSAKDRISDASSSPSMSMAFCWLLLLSLLLSVLT